MMNHEKLGQLRLRYPAGCRIVLDEMDDPYMYIPVGTQGTVTGVDDAGNIGTEWDCNSSLNVAYRADRCHKLRTEDEAKVTLDWYGKHQLSENSVCPRCGWPMWGKTSRHAVSRRASIAVCDECGTHEALEDAGIEEKLPLMKWAAIAVPQAGGGRWKR